MSQKEVVAEIKLLLKSIDNVYDMPSKLEIIAKKIIGQLELLKGTEKEDNAKLAIDALKHTIFNK